MAIRLTLLPVELRKKPPRCDKPVTEVCREMAALSMFMLAMTEERTPTSLVA
jgi:hypothetical protein